MSKQLLRLIIPTRCILPTRKFVNFKVFCRLCSSQFININNQCLTVPLNNYIHLEKPSYFCKRKLLLRNYSMGSSTDINIDYNQLIDLKNNDKITIIDVREKEELKETGEIPGSFNIPLGEVAQALTKLSSDEFKNKYGFPKPLREDKLVFSCRSGKRSLMAHTEAVKAGYTNSLNFSGGWLGWEENTKPK